MGHYMGVYGGCIEGSKKVTPIIDTWKQMLKMMWELR